MTDANASTKRPTFDLRGTALITGASGGLGQAYAESLAREGLDLVLTARRADELEKLASTLRERHGHQVTVLPADLSDREARTRLADDIAGRGITIDVLINNAGFGTHGDFAEIDTDRVLREVEVNVAALTHMARLFLPAMRQRGHGLIVNIASTAAFQPIPSMAVYAATKSYVLSLSQALWSENLTTGVRVIAVCPGPTETEFFANTGEPDSMKLRRAPEQVVNSTFRAVNANQPQVVDGALNNVIARVSHAAPVKLKLPLARAFAKPRP